MKKGRMPRLACGLFLCLPLMSCSQSTAPDAADNRQLENAADLLEQAPGELNAVDENVMTEPAQDPAAVAPPRPDR